MTSESALPRLAPAKLQRVTIRMLIADDQELVRAGFKMTLDAQPGIEVSQRSPLAT
ncbi:hypothetical protein GCM10022419_105650 [Nonomuraea rosea]|uniref:DNA-binding response regulator n=1 Tax=Nonomuraea rosea TaxID=638574 RepID=A0ABP6ZEK9_9ACTN